MWSHVHARTHLNLAYRLNTEEKLKLKKMYNSTVSAKDKFVELYLCYLQSMSTKVLIMHFQYKRWQSCRLKQICLLLLIIIMELNTV